jgi:hypothetical protein
VWFLFSKVKGSLTARREEGGEREKKKAGGIVERGSRHV